jgi:hypothetical protein
MQHDEHYREYLQEIANRNEIVWRNPVTGLLELQEPYICDRDMKWCFTDKGTAYCVGVC